MKSLFILLVSCCLIFTSRAATNITTPTVSGHWTLAGSPYKINNDITIPTGQSLLIDPGVEVLFQGYYSLKVYGSLQSAGTATMPISYRIADTTGKYMMSSLAGGWAGIMFDSSTGSTFEYSNVCDIKSRIDIGVGFNLHNTTLKLYQCKFYNNLLYIDWDTVTTVDLPGILYFENSNIDMDGCAVYNNVSFLNTISKPLFTAGTSVMKNCSVHHNRSVGIPGRGASIFLVGDVALLNNTVYNEVCSDGTFVNVSGFGMGQHSIIRDNKFYFNTNKENAAINCRSDAIIENNFICNNVDDSAWCGGTSGGGAIHVIPNGDTGAAIIRNNVIANNVSANFGSAIYTYDCNTIIVNNHIINNECRGQAAIYASVGYVTNRHTTIKNNIFYGNVDIFGTASVDVVFSCFLTSTIDFNHNWTERNISANVQATVDSVIWGDTAANIIGTDPALVSPTLTHDVTENALTSDFSLLSTSLCINQGAPSMYAGAKDYIYNGRVAGGNIDIGAFEYGSTPTTQSVASKEKSKAMSIFPNPAKEMLFVATPSGTGTLQLQDISGKLLVEKSICSAVTKFDTQLIPRGLYVIVWRNVGHNIEVQKVVVE